MSIEDKEAYKEEFKRRGLVGNGGDLTSEQNANLKKVADDMFG
jgi:hypothetical protein